MKKMRKIVCFMLAMALVAVTSVAGATIYFERKASMKLFSGRIERIETGTTAGTPTIPTPAPEAPRLVLCVGTRFMGVAVGTAWDISEESSIPILVDASSNPTTWVDAHGKEATSAPVRARATENDFSWHDSNGKEALAAPVFTLTAANGGASNVAMRIEVTGDSTAFPTLRYGVHVVHYIPDMDTYARMESKILDVHPDGVSDVLTIGDMLEGEFVEVYVSTWATSYDLARVEYAGEPVFAEAVFSYEV